MQGLMDLGHAEIPQAFVLKISFLSSKNHDMSIVGFSIFKLYIKNGWMAGN